MSRMLSQSIATLAARTASVVAASSLIATTLSAQAALGTPFIGANNLSFQAAELTRTGTTETTTIFGAAYGRQFGAADAATRPSLTLRGSARSLEDFKIGVLDIGGTVALSHQIAVVPGLSVAASTGVGVRAWNDDATKKSRLAVDIPANAGVSYDLHLFGATLSPFAMGTVSRYDHRTALDDVRQTVNRGWDTYYTAGASLRVRDLVFTTSEVVGEHGMPNRSRWMFSAGVSF